MREISTFRNLLPLLVTMMLLPLAGCGNKEGKLVAPLKPFVRITGGPLEQSSDSYTARIFWTGWDEDGIIEHYEYATDPPPVFTREEIDNPVGSPGLVLTTIPGPAEHQDTLRVCKTEGGVEYCYDWVQTREFSRTFAFKTPNPDSTLSTGTLEPDQTWSGPHRLYVRGLDNDDLYSDVEEIGYNAFTFTPTATISRPNISAELSNLGTTVTIGWDGIDPDSPDANKKPVGYLYRMLRLDTLDPPVPLIFATEERLYDRGDRIWKYQRADTLRRTFQLAAGAQYIFGVRAVDLAGAEEPFLEFGRNVFKFQSFADGGRPTLQICEPAFGCFDFRGIGKPEEVEVPTGKILRFTWSASAEAYGGEIDGYSWGYDIPDLERPEGWSTWGDITISDPRSFRNPGVHVFYARTRDESGTLALGAVILNVIRFSFEREVLWIDDAKDSNFPNDAEHDAFWRRRLNGYPGGLNWFEFQADAPLSPKVPELEEMGRYRLLVWENTVGAAGQSALLTSSTIRPTLGSYLGAGGQAWIGGRITVTAMLPPKGAGANLEYPKTEIVQGDFAYDFMKLRSNRIDREDGGTTKNFFVGVRPFPSQPSFYDSMSVDVTKLRQPFQFALTHVDAVFGPIFAENDPTFVGDIDSVYAYRAYGNEVTNQPSSYHNKLVGLRWRDMNPDRLHGRIQWFGFPMYYIFEDQAQDTFNKSVDWFHEETVVTP